MKRTGTLITAAAAGSAMLRYMWGYSGAAQMLLFSTCCVAASAGCGRSDPRSAEFAYAATPVERPSSSTNAPLSESQVPRFRLRSTDGRVLDSTDFAGRPVVLVFFTSWCPVCAREVPVVQNTVRQSGDGVAIIGVALDEDDAWAGVDGFVKRAALEFPVVRGAKYGDFLDVYNPDRAFPLVVVIDAAGRESFTQRGAPKDATEKLEPAIASARSRTDRPSR